MKIFWMTLFCLFPTAGTRAGELSVCAGFYQELAGLPHVELVVRSDTVVSDDLADHRFRGCEVVFKSRAELLGERGLPDFAAKPGSEYYKKGWRPDYAYCADGPGSGKYGVVNNSLLCIIDWDQQAWIDENGEIQQSEEINMAIRCLDREKPVH